MKEDIRNLDEFGLLLTVEIRDTTLKYFHRAFTEAGGDIYSIQLHKLVKAHPEVDKALLERIITHAIDSTIGTFLQFFDRHSDNMEIRINCKDGVQLKLGKLTDGLEAEYSWSEGWARTYSVFPSDAVVDLAEGRS